MNLKGSACGTVEILLSHSVFCLVEFFLSQFCVTLTKVVASK